MAASGEVINQWDPLDGMRILVGVTGDWGDYSPEGEVIGPPAPSISWLWLIVAAAAAYVLSRKR